MRDGHHRVRADDVTLRVDTLGYGGCGSRDINACDASLLVKQEPMSGAASSVLANDVTPSVDTDGHGG